MPDPIPGYRLAEKTVVRAPPIGTRARSGMAACVRAQPPLPSLSLDCEGASHRHPRSAETWAKREAEIAPGFAGGCSSGAETWPDFRGKARQNLSSHGALLVELVEKQAGSCPTAAARGCDRVQ